MSDDFADWEKNRDGTIKLNPVTGWVTGVAFGMGVIAQLHFARSDGELRRGIVHKLPLGMTPAQARELAQALLKKADQIEHGSDTRGSPN